MFKCVENKQLSGFETGQSIGNAKSSFGGTVSIKRATSKFLKHRKSKGSPPPVDVTLTGCELDGVLQINASEAESVWANAIGATNADEAVDDSTSEDLPISVSRSNFSNCRFYFRFNGGNFNANVATVTKATLKVYVAGTDNSSDADANKWKAFKHNDITTSNLAVGDYSTYDSSISGDETTVTAGAYIEFPLTGDLLAYVQTQAIAQADVAFLLICKLDYGSTAPTGENNNIEIDFTESSNDPKLDITYTT